MLLLLLLLQVELPDGLCEYTMRATAEQLQQSLASAPLLLQVCSSSSSSSGVAAATDCCLGEARVDLSPLLQQPLLTDAAAPHNYQMLGLRLPLQQQQQQQQQRTLPLVEGKRAQYPLILITGMLGSRV